MSVFAQGRGEIEINTCTNGGTNLRFDWFLVSSPIKIRPTSVAAKKLACVAPRRLELLIATGSCRPLYDEAGRHSIEQLGSGCHCHSPQALVWSGFSDSLVVRTTCFTIRAGRL